MVNWQIKNELKEFLLNHKNNKILDFGCGDARYKKFIEENNEYIGVDSKTTGFENSKKNADIYWDNQTLPFENESFDIIICTEVLHQVDDIDNTINELKRVLKKGGKLIIYEPNKLNPLIWLTHLIDKNERGLLRVGSFKRYREIFSDTDFKIEEESYNGIVIGPSSKIFDNISNFLNHKIIYPVLGFLNPKIFLVVNKT